MLAMAPLASILILLNVYQEHPSVAWMRTIILRTTLSTLATVMEASLLLPARAHLGQLKSAWYHREKNKVAPASHLHWCHSDIGRSGIGPICFDSLSRIP